MKLQELPLSTPQTTRTIPQFIPLAVLTFLLTLIITTYFPFSLNELSLTSFSGNQNLQNTEEQIDVGETSLPQDHPENSPPSKAAVGKPEGRESKNPTPAQTDLTITKDSKAEENVSMIRSKTLDGKCDLFTGEWVPNAEGPYYTNTTCNVIEERQNCMKFGRPDRGFLKWKWKPDDCELPVFDPTRFLDLVKGKSFAFVGDSVARNHMQSLICLLSRVVQPVYVSNPKYENRLYQYREYDFSITLITSPYLIRAERTDPNDILRPYNLFLDEFDETWTTKIQTFDYIVISAGQWFLRPTYFYLNQALIGCLYCPEPNVTHLSWSFGYQLAFKTAFRAINNAENFTGVTFLRTYAMTHFEGGLWNSGGDCVRTRPFRRNESALEYYSLEMYLIQLEELRIAQEAGKRTGGKFRLLDVTKATLLRPDGHPSKYGRYPIANQTFMNDCVHWCLPGPIDTWNYFLQELLKREVEKEI